VTPERDERAVWINQDAWFSFADLDIGASLRYASRMRGAGLYLFLIEGEVDAAGETLHRRDAVGMTEVEDVELSARQDSRLLLIEVSMQA
jgi:hypothetical protein